MDSETADKGGAPPPEPDGRAGVYWPRAERIGGFAVGTGSPVRVQVWDIYRGLAILSVLFIHVLGHFLSPQGGNPPRIPYASPAWYPLAVCNIALKFAVPSFITLSAYLNASHLLQGYHLGRYAWRRIRKVLWPYLLWSDIYLIFRYWGQVANMDWALVLPKLMWGKVYYHLYFFIVVLQMYVLLPLLVPFFRRRPSFWAVAASAVMLQAIFYLVNRFYYPILYVGTTVLWYVPSVLLGLWLASQSHRLADIVRKGLPAAALLAGAGFAVHCPLALDLMRKEPVDSLLYQVSFWVYTTSFSFVLVAVARRLRSREGTPLLQSCGMYSLPIYVLHPLVIWAMDAYFPSRGFFGNLSAIVIYYSACLLIPLLVARLVALARVSRFLFGNDDQGYDNPRQIARTIP